MCVSSCKILLTVCPELNKTFLCHHHGLSSLCRTSCAKLLRKWIASPYVGIRLLIFNIKLIICSFAYCFTTLLTKSYITVQCLSLVIGQTVYQAIITDKSLKKVTIFSILYCKYDCNFACHKNSIMIHSLVYELGNHIAASSFTMCELLYL